MGLQQTLEPPDADTAALRSGDQLGGWTLVNHLGSGGYGDVYAAKNVEGHEAAIKVYRPRQGAVEDESGRKRFRRGPEALAKLAEPRPHPNIVRLVEGPNESDDHLWYAMQLVPGKRSKLDALSP